MSGPWWIRELNILQNVALYALVAKAWVLGWYRSGGNEWVCPGGVTRQIVVLNDRPVFATMDDIAALNRGVWNGWFTRRIVAERKV